MTTFDDREAAFENKFVHDENMKFKAAVRGCKQVALWAASLLGKGDEAAETYAESMSSLDLLDADHTDLVAMLSRDLGPQVSTADISKKVEEEFAKALEQILSEPDLDLLKPS